jgi:hypothetical protein
MKVTAGAGSSTYFGDLCETGDCLTARPQASLGFNFRFTGKFTVRGEVSYYRLANKDFGGKNQNRNLSFRSGNIELYGAAVYEFLPYNKFFQRRPFFNPYVFAGLGLTFFNPRAKLNDEWYTLAKYDTENVNYNQAVPIIPFGGGLQMAISPVVDISIEVAYRKTFTDYLDDVSTVYADNAAIRARSPIGADLADRTHELFKPTYDAADGMHWNAGHKRGNPDKKDGYLMASIKMEYTLNPLVKTQRRNLKFKRPRFSKGSSSSGRRKKR